MHEKLNHVELRQGDESEKKLLNVVATVSNQDEKLKTI